MTKPLPGQLSDDELDARLRATFERAVADAATRMAAADLPLVRPSRTRLVRAITSGPAMAAGAIAVLVLLVAVMGNGNPAPPVGATSAPGVNAATAPAFGEPVWPVGAGAAEHIDSAAATTLISGWVRGAAPNPQCTGAASPSTPSPIDPCSKVTLFASPAGGSQLDVFAVGLPAVEPETARQFVLRVDPHDPACAATSSVGMDCVIVVQVLWTGDAVQLPIAPPSAQTGDSTIDGPVYPVGGGAVERLRAATDDTPFLVSGWLIGTGIDTPCSSTPPGLTDPCAELWLYATAGGGDSLPIVQGYAVTVPEVATGTARHVVLRVDSRDPVCSTAWMDPTCYNRPVLLAVVQADAPGPISESASEPAPAGISAAEAVDRAVNGAHTQGPYDTAVSAVPGTAGTNNPMWPDVASWRYVWIVTLTSSMIDPSLPDLHVMLDYATGTWLGSYPTPPTGGPVPSPMAAVPARLADVPVHQADDARQAIEESGVTPLFVGGWLLGADSRICPAGTPDPHEAAWNPCAGVWLHPDASGGTPIALFVRPVDLSVSLRPAEGEAIPVVFRVHTHDPHWDPSGTYTSAADAALPVIEELVWQGKPVAIPTMGTAPGGISQAAALKAAQPYLLLKGTPALRAAVPVTLAGVKAMTGAEISGPGTTPASWVWLLIYADGSTPARTASSMTVLLDTGQPLVGEGSFP
jgi:hypothetical protein